MIKAIHNFILHGYEKPAQELDKQSDLQDYIYCKITFLIQYEY